MPIRRGGDGARPCGQPGQLIVTAYPDTEFPVCLLCEAIKFTGGSGARGQMKNCCMSRRCLRMGTARPFAFKCRDIPQPARRLALADAQVALNRFETDLASSLLCSHHAIFRTCLAAPGSFRRHTMAGGHRSFDVLHVATALHLGAREFLTFDGNQRKLAAAEKLKVKP